MAPDATGPLKVFVDQLLLRFEEFLRRRRPSHAAKYFPIDRPMVWADFSRDAGALDGPAILHVQRPETFCRLH